MNAARAAASSSSCEASGLPVQQVATDRRVEQVGLLGDHPDDLAERLERDVAHVDAVDLDRPLLHVVEAGDQVRHRRLAGSARADERRELAGLDVAGRHVVERPLARRLVSHRRGRLGDVGGAVSRLLRRRVVAEPHVAEADRAAHPVGLQRAWRSGASTISCSMSRYSKIRSNSAIAICTSTFICSI